MSRRDPQLDPEFDCTSDRPSDRKTVRHRLVIAALLVAAGQLAASGLAAFAEALWVLLAAPLLLALVIVVAGFYLRPVGGPTSVRTALVLAVGLLTSAALVAQADPESLRAMLPVIGGTIAAMVVLVPADAVGGRREIC